MTRDMSVKWTKLCEETAIKGERKVMSELHPETLAERIRYLGIACQCCTCRGSDKQIDAIIAEYDAKQHNEIKRLRAEIQDGVEKNDRLLNETIEQHAEIERLERFIIALDPCPKCWGMETDKPCTCSTAARAVNAEAEVNRLERDLDDVTAMLRVEYERENPGLPMPDFVMMAKAKREAAEAAGGNHNA